MSSKKHAVTMHGLDVQALNRTADDMDLPLDRFFDCLIAGALHTPDLIETVEGEDLEMMVVPLDDTVYASLKSGAERIGITPDRLAEALTEAAYGQGRTDEVAMEAIAREMVDLSDLGIGE